MQVFIDHRRSCSAAFFSAATTAASLLSSLKVTYICPKKKKKKLAFHSLIFGNPFFPSSPTFRSPALPYQFLPLREKKKGKKGKKDPPKTKAPSQQIPK